jgi:Uma2 family endonuclease
MSTVEVLEPETVATSIADEALYEILDGKRVELPPMGAYAVRVAFKLGAKMEHFAETRELGVAITESLFRLQSEPNLQRRPDAAYVSFQRWPKGRRIPFGNAWDVVPDLVVEVVSPTNYAEEFPTKVREYFEAGVRRAWIIYVHESLVYEYDSPISIRVFTRQDTLDGGEVIPGFRLPLSDLFEGAEETETA